MVMLRVELELDHQRPKPNKYDHETILKYALQMIPNFGKISDNTLDSSCIGTLNINMVQKHELIMKS